MWQGGWIIFHSHLMYYSTHLHVGHAESWGRSIIYLYMSHFCNTLAWDEAVYWESKSGSRDAGKCCLFVCFKARQEISMCKKKETFIMAVGIPTYPNCFGFFFPVISIANWEPLIWMGEENYFLTALAFIYTKINTDFCWAFSFGLLIQQST